MMAMTSGVERGVEIVSEGAEWGGLLLLFGSLVSGLGVKITMVVKVVEGRTIVWVRVRKSDWVERRARRENDDIASLEEVVVEET